MVKFSLKSDYAARAVLGLARRYHQGSAIRVEDLASEYSIPANYLVQILIELKSQQIVKSKRGKVGGYMLARHPAEITLGDILRSVQGQVFEMPTLQDTRSPPEIRDAWGKILVAAERTANSITIQSLVEENGDRAKMYYI
jgi:Rrf2 family cysteine metabolism transcriptional repressor